MLQNSDQPLIVLSIELENLERYLEMEKIRFENRPFNYSIIVEPSLDAEQTKVPPMLLQPIAENALWHGLLKQKEPRELEIICTGTNDRFQLTVKDNGIGYSADPSNTHRDRPSLSLSNIRQRIDLYNRLGYGHAQFNINAFEKTNTTATGTEVTFTFDN